MNAKNKDNGISKQVENTIEDLITDSGRLPSTREIIAATGFGERKVRDALVRLVSEARIRIVYEARKNPTIYMPSYMFDAVLRGQKCPPWIEKYVFPEASNISQEIRSKEEQLTVYKKTLDLLFSTGRTLEEAVGQSLEKIQVENLKLTYEDSEKWDVSFLCDGTTFISDIKGKSKWADKDDIGQLHGWLTRYVDENPDADSESLCGLLIVNHFKDLNPDERWPKNPERRPLSTHGEKFLKLYHSKFLTTFDLFTISQCILKGEMSPAGARGLLMKSIRTEV